MSWQTYVDKNLVGSGLFAKAAIIGLEGGVWAKTAGYEISTTEQKAIVDGFGEKGRETLHAQGIHVQGQKFFTVQADERRVGGKKGADGIVIVKTKQAVLIAEYVAPNQAGQVTPLVENLADYLIGLDY